MAQSDSTDGQTEKGESASQPSSPAFKAEEAKTASPSALAPSPAKRDSLAKQDSPPARQLSLQGIVMVLVFTFLLGILFSVITNFLVERVLFHRKS